MTDPLPATTSARPPRLRFDRHELAGGSSQGRPSHGGVRRGWVKTPSVGTEAVRVHE